MDERQPATAQTAPGLSRLMTLAMAATAGMAVANIYYNQPMLGLIEAEFPKSTFTDLIPTATQLGYAAGLFFLIPIGDLCDRRRLIIAQFIVLGVSLALMASAATPLALFVASLLVGACATVAQQIVPFAASLAPAGRRGSVVGTVMAGVLCGILFSRTLAGLVAAHAGWRDVFWFSLPMALIASGLMAALLPHDRKSVSIGYKTALASMGTLWRKEPSLRRATFIQAALFASFSVFWTSLSLHLQEPPFGLGADIAGLFGIVGAVGICAAPIAGRIADRRGPALTILVGGAATLLAWILFRSWDAIPGLVAGVIILDFGVQSSLVSNQHIALSLDQSARGRINTIFMTGMFLGGAAGSAGALLAWDHVGWDGVCAFGGVLAAIALATALAGHRQTAIPVTGR